MEKSYKLPVLALNLILFTAESIYAVESPY